MPFDNPHQTSFGDLDVLEDARSRIFTQDRWIKRRFQIDERLCVVAALSLAAGSRHFNMPNRTERRLTRLLAVQIPPRKPFFKRITLLSARQRLIKYNDSSGTGHPEVIAPFDRAIHHLVSEAPDARRVFGLQQGRKQVRAVLSRLAPFATRRVA
jgi:hypothetical protein